MVRNEENTDFAKSAAFAKLPLQAVRAAPAANDSKVPHCANAPGPAPRSLCKRQIRRAAAKQKTSASCVKQLSSQSPQSPRHPASPTPLPVAYPPNAVVTIFSDGCVRLLGDRSHPARPRHIWPRHQLRRPKIGPALRGAARDRSLARRALRGQIGILSARP